MERAIFTEFAVSAVLVVICVTVHGLGLAGLSLVLRSEAANERLKAINPLSLRGSLFTLGIVVAMVALHGLEIWLFALTYLATHAVHGFEEALYFSTISYSTVGYSDTHILPEWRLVGAFESILGVILLGWSTAFFLRMISRIDPH
ncbi:two pore domain potassium channel family protein [Altererythrobacter sp. CC-YST694]|uniref:ion channel n=1 Tax=Altererythrobacter sp. CC-YST694 TaxID=2755038 RepID=UPI001D02DB06|nr:ion channel [Altererythrobacter sp. CC-YST694]MCB5426110.1 two pore domain potassium channel family protein [Altererythrobacter sp. CC-YST694]